MAKSINMVWVLHIARVRTKNTGILNLRIGLFKAALSYVEWIVRRKPTDYLRQRRSVGGQWGTYGPGRQGTGAPKWSLHKFDNNGKKPVTSKIAPAADIVW